MDELMDIGWIDREINRWMKEEKEIDLNLNIKKKQKRFQPKSSYGRGST